MYAWNIVVFDGNEPTAKYLSCLHSYTLTKMYREAMLTYLIEAVAASTHTRKARYAGR
jgi:hypothetical protein